MPSAMQPLFEPVSRASKIRKTGAEASNKTTKIISGIHKNDLCERCVLAWSSNTNTTACKLIYLTVVCWRMCHPINGGQASDDEPSIQWRGKLEPVHTTENNSAVKKKVAEGHLRTNTRQACGDEPSWQWREKLEPVHKAENNLFVEIKGGRRAPSKMIRQG